MAFGVLGTLQGQAQSPALPVVPGAAGFGMNTRAAYGGSVAPVVLRVTSLSNSGPGTLRAALEGALPPRVVIFEVSGYINLVTPIFVTSPFVTLAGQTAPSPGITVRGGDNDATVEFQTHDVLVQHIRVRPGAGTCNNALGAYPGPSNIVFDHVSISWSTDEGFYFFGADPVNATLWRSIAAEGLVYDNGSCGGGGGSSSHGILVYKNAHNISIIQNITAKNAERNPYLVTGSWSQVINNLIYQWSGVWGITTASNKAADGDNPWYVTAVGNRFVAGPGTGSAYMFFHISVGDPIVTNRMYRSDNTLANQGQFGTVTDVGNQLGYNPDTGSPPSVVPIPSGFTPLPSASVEAFLLANAGARPADRDAVDLRIVQEVKSRTGRFISNPSEVGGYPTLATNTRTLTLPANPHTVTSSQYTNLEVWLHGYAATVEGTTPTTPPVPATPTGFRITS